MKKRIISIMLAIFLLCGLGVYAAEDSLTEEEVYNSLISMKKLYPEGALWDGASEYDRPDDDNFYFACWGFAWLLSDAAFGDARAVSCDYNYEDLRVGDIVIANTGWEGHAFVILEKYDHGVYIAEGNFNNKVHWGRYISRATLDSENPDPIFGMPVKYSDTFITRYPQACYHEYVMGKTIIEPCAEDGYYENVCSLCGDVKREEITIFGGNHNWGDWVTVREAQGYIPGMEIRRCSDCGKEAEREIVDEDNPFWDVGDSDYYYIPVLWALNENITTGYSQNKFAPDEKCTRAQAVTFLWRAAGSPKPGLQTENFEDVDEDDYFYEAVLWALEEGITTGVSDTRFAPGDNCTRGQIVTFMWRCGGRPDAEAAAFSDVRPSDYYYTAVAWAAEKGISTGYADGRFGPADSCTRAQMVTFLYRYLG